MKKVKTSKDTKAKKVKQDIITKPVPKLMETKKEVRKLNNRSLSIYVYWFIIIFFIASTFYILGRSHNLLIKSDVNNVEISEEHLMQVSEYLNSGKVNLIEKKIDDAISDFTVVIQTDDSFVDAYILRGEAYMQSGDFEKAMNDFTIAIKKDSNNSVAFYDRAILHKKMEDLSAALSDINSALAIRAVHPNDVLKIRDLYAERGKLNLWLKNWEGAIADYTNSLARPEGTVNHNVYAERAEAYTALSRYKDAANDYTSAIRVISEQIQGASSPVEKEDLSRKALSYFEKSAGLNVNLGDLNAAKSDLESAYSIAVALDDSETIDRLTILISEMN